MIASSRPWTNDRSQATPAAGRIPTASSMAFPVCCRMFPASVLMTPDAILTAPARCRTTAAAIPTRLDSIQTTTARCLTTPDFTKTLVFRGLSTKALIAVVSSLWLDESRFPATGRTLQISPQRHFLRMEKTKTKGGESSWQKTRQFPWAATA